MKAKHLVLAMLGAAALTGCRSEVMENRGYVPAPSSDTPGAVTEQQGPATTEIAAPPAETPATASASAPASAPAETPRFAPMTGVVSSGGVDSAPRQGVKSGKKDAAGGEAGVYVVQPGDFPEKIARKLHVRLGDLMKANNLTPESAKRLRIGQKLTIPAKSAAAPKSSGKKATGRKSSKPAAAGDKAPAAEVKDGVYVVQPGDFPEKIARKLHVKLGDLMKANDLTPEKAARLQIGQKLIVPGKSAAAAKPKKGEKSETTPAQPAPAAPAGTSEVGETLKEAEQATVTTTTAASETAKPAAGTETAAESGSKEVVVNIESHPEVVEEDEISVEEFARRHHTTVDMLRKVNPDLKPDTTAFKKHEIIFVPGKSK